MLEQVTLACGCIIGMSQQRLRKALSSDRLGVCGVHGQQKIERKSDGTSR